MATDLDMGVDGWQPISTAPKDETVPILVAFDHDADPYQDPNNPDHLTDYAAVAEGGDFLSGKGVSMVVWRDGYHDSDGWESGNSYWVPGGWFAYLNGDATDYVVNAILWMPIPALPTVHDGCRNCEGSGWVCENHPCIAWHGLAGKIRCCGGAGMPCPVCDNKPTPEISRA